MVTLFDWMTHSFVRLSWWCSGANRVHLRRNHGGLPPPSHAGSVLASARALRVRRSRVPLNLWRSHAAAPPPHAVDIRPTDSAAFRVQASGSLGCFTSIGRISRRQVPFVHYPLRFPLEYLWGKKKYFGRGPPSAGLQGVTRGLATSLLVHRPRGMFL
jgi:hypothetical protein